MISQSVLHDFQDDFVVDLGPEITESVACGIYNTVAVP